MVLVDFNGLAISSIMGQLSHGEELSENLVKHIILNNLRMYRKNILNHSMANQSDVVIVTLGAKTYSQNTKPTVKLLVVKISTTGQ